MNDKSMISILGGGNEISSSHRRDFFFDLYNQRVGLVLVFGN